MSVEDCECKIAKDLCRLVHEVVEVCFAVLQQSRAINQVRLDLASGLVRAYSNLQQHSVMLANASHCTNVVLAAYRGHHNPTPAVLAVKASDINSVDHTMLAGSNHAGWQLVSVTKH